MEIIISCPESNLVDIQLIRLVSFNITPEQVPCSVLGRLFKISFYLIYQRTSLIGRDTGVFLSFSLCLAVNYANAINSVK